MKKVAVIGCGIIGLTTSIRLQEKFPHLDITIITKETSPNTTSDIAAGLWEPFLVSNTSQEKITKWSRVTYEYLLKWWREGKAKEYGICLVPTTYLDDEITQLPTWVKGTLGYQELSRKDIDYISDIFGEKLKFGLNFVSFTWESSVILPCLQKQFVAKGGVIERREVRSLEELDLFDVVVNCTGLGARELIKDETVYPIRGQIEKVAAPWQYEIKIISTKNKTAYIIPNMNLCTLGGTAIKTFDDSISEEQKQLIKNACKNISPSISSAKTVKYLVGLRPGRPEVRLEIDLIQGTKKLVIHNYGHGGAGVTLSLGCAEEVVDLMSLLLKKHKL